VPARRWSYRHRVPHADVQVASGAETERDLVRRARQPPVLDADVEAPVQVRERVAVHLDLAEVDGRAVHHGDATHELAGDDALLLEACFDRVGDVDVVRDRGPGRRRGEPVEARDEHQPSHHAGQPHHGAGDGRPHRDRSRAPAWLQREAQAEDGGRGAAEARHPRHERALPRRRVRAPPADWCAREA
jgi:hypothetical protein